MSIYFPHITEFKGTVSSTDLVDTIRAHISYLTVIEKVLKKRRFHVPCPTNERWSWATREKLKSLWRELGGDKRVMETFELRFIEKLERDKETRERPLGKLTRLPWKDNCINTCKYRLLKLIHLQWNFVKWAKWTEFTVCWVMNRYTVSPQSFLLLKQNAFLWVFS